MKRSIWVFFGTLVISAWILGLAIQAGGETLKCKITATRTKVEAISVGDEEGHRLGVEIWEGLGFCENGEITKVRTHSIFDFVAGKGAQSINYNILTFEDGSTIVNRTQRLLVADQGGNLPGKSTGELIKGTGRFEGIKGSSSMTGKNFVSTKEESARNFNESTFTYTLPIK